MAHIPDVVDPRHPLVERVRVLCLRYGGVAEVKSWGRPTFRVNGKIFVVVAAMADRPYSIVIKPDSVDEPALRQDPRFFTPPYWGPFGWLAIDADDGADWSEVAELIDASYRLVAPRRLVRDLDADPIVR